MTISTVGDLVSAALHESGVLGVGQTALAEDSNSALDRLNLMADQWARKRWLIYQTVDAKVVSTGQLSYTIGPGGDITADVNGRAITNRPDRVEAAFFRQLVNSNPNQIDYPLELLGSREAYNNIALKNLTSFSSYLFYDPGFPRGVLYPWPVMQATIYELHVTLKQQLSEFASLATAINLPLEYYAALLYNLALRLRAKYNIPPPPGDMLVGLAKDSLNVLRGANFAIPALLMPADLSRPGIYNPYSDQIR